MSDPVPSLAIYDASAAGRSVLTAADAAAQRTVLELATYYAAIGHDHSGVYSPVGHTHPQSDITNLTTDLGGKQDTLISGTNIKTVNSTSLLGSGDIAVSASPYGSSGQVQYNNAGAFGGTTAIVYSGSGTHLTVTAQLATDVPLKIKGAASQTGNMLEIRNSSDVIGACFSPANGGQFLSGASTLYKTAFGASNFAALGYFGSTEFQFYPYANTSWGFSSGTDYLLTSYRSVYLSTNTSGLHGVHIPPANNPQAAWDVHAAVDSVVLRAKLLSTQTANSVVIVNSSDVVQFAIAANGRDMILDTTTGTKIGTGTTQKIGFWNATPVVQQVLATGGGATVDNVISLLQTLGLCRQS